MGFWFPLSSSPLCLLRLCLLFLGTDGTARRTGSLCCESAEEAKTLIPSISNKISDGDLQELLDDMMKLRNFVE